MNFEYVQPVKIIFGNDSSRQLGDCVKALGKKAGVLVSDKVLVDNGTAARIAGYCGGAIKATFSDIQPNPTVENVDNCARAIREAGADFVVALGGGSGMDCAKAAATIALTDDSIVKYHGTGVALPSAHLPLIAMPTTAGTGSEVTAVSVLSNHETHLKAPVASPNFYPDIAIVDPVLTYTVPAKAAASTGLDVLAHALEGYMSKNAQPICDANAIYAAELVFRYLERACLGETDKEAKEKMALASVMAGLAFNLPKTGPSHACSFPLTNRYGIPHGEACALTLDTFIRVNMKEDSDRLNSISQKLGFADGYALADAVYDLKKKVGLRVDIKDLGLSDADTTRLVKESHHPNMLNSVTEITDGILLDMYNSMR